MSDIVDRLRDPINQDIPFTELMLDAAARIEQLEAALREIADYGKHGWAIGLTDVARAALEERT